MSESVTEKMFLAEYKNEMTCREQSLHAAHALKQQQQQQKQQQQQQHNKTITCNIITVASQK
jgi:hypothetical protein